MTTSCVSTCNIYASTCKFDQYIYTHTPAPRHPRVWDTNIQPKQSGVEKSRRTWKPARQHKIYTLTTISRTLEWKIHIYIYIYMYIYICVNIYVYRYITTTAVSSRSTRMWRVEATVLGLRPKERSLWIGEATRLHDADDHCRFRGRASTDATYHAG